MQIHFKIESLPSKGQEKYATAYLEGNLVIDINGRIFFDQHNILLIELAIFFHKWLNNIEAGNVEDFCYQSMDHEDTILVAIPANENFYQIDSIWKAEEWKPLVEIGELKNAMKTYLNELNKQIVVELDVSLDQIFRALDE